ncbi:MAG: hypothetical protein J7L15_01095 [Clostridiales bacterium]|nr:hypothetical protein [Clostridiales bacterium]
MTDIILKNRMKTLDNCDEFFHIFRLSLKKFWPNNIEGFDVIAFDDFLQPEEGESSYEAVERKYGKKGFKLIKKLLA